MEEDFRALLLAATAVTDIVASRIDYGGGPQGQETPRIALWTISDQSRHVLSGPEAMSTGRVQVDCYGSTYKEAATLARAVRASLDGVRDANFQGIFHAGTVGTREGGSNEVSRPFLLSLDFITNHQ